MNSAADTTALAGPIGDDPPAAAPPRLVVLEHPQSIFYKDEGGKSNHLHFRFSFEGGLLSDEDLAACGAVRGGLLAVLVQPVYENGDPVLDRPGVLEVLGGSVVNAEGSGDAAIQSTSMACLSTQSLTGGVRYRITAVSKRLGNRGLCVQISLPGLPHIAPITSQPTMVFSKRKNKQLRRQSSSSSALALAAAGDSDSQSDAETGGDAPPAKKQRRAPSFQAPPALVFASSTSSTSSSVYSPRPLSAAAAAASTPQPPPMSMCERMDFLHAEQKKLYQVVLELRKLNHQIQQRI